MRINFALVVFSFTTKQFCKVAQCSPILTKPPGPLYYFENADYCWLKSPKEEYPVGQNQEHKSTLCHCPTGQSWPFSAWDIYYRRWEQYYPYYRPTNPSQPRHSLWLHWLRSVQGASAHVEKCPQIGGAVMSGDISDPAKLRAGPLPHWVMPRRRKTAGWAPGYCHVGLVFQKGAWENSEIARELMFIMEWGYLGTWPKNYRAKIGKLGYIYCEWNLS